MSKKKFMKFVPYNLVNLIENNMTDDEIDEIENFFKRLILKKSVYCGHCDKLIKCSGPCELYLIRGSCNCGYLCYSCYSCYKVIIGIYHVLLKSDYFLI